MSLTLGEYLRFLLPRDLDNPPAWPPDMFAICASLLLKSGSYCSVLTDWPPAKYKETESWADEARSLGLKWREDWVASKSVPEDIVALWKSLTTTANLARPLSDFAHNVELWQVTLQLFVFADEACAGVGSPPVSDDTPMDRTFMRRAAELLSRMGHYSLGDEIDAGRVRVLPKMHTPQTGLTIRSFSMYLALCNPSEVVPQWVNPRYQFPDDSLNLLLVPWPLEIYPIQFRASRALATETRNIDKDRFGLFTVDPLKRPGDIMTLVTKLLDAANEHIGRVDGIVLPEAAVTPAQHEAIAKFAGDNKIFLVSGVATVPEGGTPGCNQVSINLPFNEELVQKKHHRWKLDESQINQYGLGSILHPEREWWEHIGIVDRCFIFAAVNSDMVLAALICEDLARPDPVGDLVRAVGPNLVIALLMDGPQLNERWSGRYATVLADDPGCSVLTLTSLGMSKLSRPRSGPSRSNVIGLWKDAKNGVPQEIELDAGAQGVLLSITMRHEEEWSADGRSDGGYAIYPVLSGIHCLKI